MSKGMGMPQIPGMGNMRGAPQGQMRINIDVMSLPNAKCVKCGNDKFISVANIKMISPIESPSGDWAHGVAQWWECSLCNYKFNPNEWVENRLKEKPKDETVNRENGAIVLTDGIAAADSSDLK
jgi:hypothetical protein